MNFDNEIPEWENTGTEPSANLKTNGFQGGYKPPASVFNWFFAKVRNAITELQTKLSSVSSTTDTALNNKVDKVSGKGLSTNDYTTAEKTKLAGVAASANNYTLPAATSGALGGIKLAAPFGISSQGVLTASNSTDSAAGLMSAAQARKVASIGANNTTVVGYSPTALGESTTADGNYAVATGENTSAHGTASFASGYRTDASGTASFASGFGTGASGENSFASGYYSTANDYQFVAGKYNINKTGCSDYDDCSDTSSIFIVGNGTRDAASNAMRITAAGKCRGINAFIASGADFAEYFEWLDGNPNNEDRRGKFVTLDGEKIRFATLNDDYILGIVTGTGAFIGNSASENWQGKYLQDVFGENLTQDVEVPEKIDEVTGEVIPAHTIKKFVVNPNYDPEQEYIERSFRKEWSPIGFHGQIVAIDDGTCQVNGYCTVSVGGIATNSNDATGYRVMKRIDESHIRVMFK